MLININKRKLEEEMYVAPDLNKNKKLHQNQKKKKYLNQKYKRPEYMKGLNFEVLSEIPCTDSYIIEVEGKDFNGRKLVNKEQVLGQQRIVWDGVLLERERINLLKNNNNKKEKK